VSYCRPTVHVYVRNFVLISLFCRPVAAKTPNFCRFCLFWTWAFSDVALWHQSQKAKHNCTTTTFPYRAASKSFLYSNTFMAKSGAQSLTFKSVPDRQTNKQTKTQPFWPARLRVKSEPHQTWHCDRGLRARSCTSKAYGGLTHSFAARGAENLGATRPLNLKPP